MFNYGYVEFAMESLADVASLTNLNAVVAKMTHTPVPSKVASRDKDVSRDFIWSKKSVKLFKQDMNAYNPMFAKMIASGVTPYSKRTGWNEYASINNRDVLKDPYVATLKYNGRAEG